ncbi:UDP-2,3-diacylglucosamine diphosphatase [Jiulongibacter sp. NS-SX5]|uniref:UDP-2,3-diacylglucosamine diphosphatase n=1 Tax=Jiulongibacter sp. NS-SX5 TaxID=3463854 RepID=UPI0040588E4B
MNIPLPAGQKVYFLSDFHLGAPDHPRSLERERRIVHWLDSEQNTMEALFLVGDLFDFWFEYGSVVPKGYVRLLGKLAELSDKGVQLFIYTGNHDFWMKDYFQKELGATVLTEPTAFQIGNHRFLVGHGDGLGPGDTSYKILKKLLFANPLCQWLFRYVLPPDIGQFLGNLWAKNSYQKNRKEDLTVQEIDPKEEFIYQYIEEQIKAGSTFDYYIFGHRHIAMQIPMSDASMYINLGDWIRFDSYAVYDGQKALLQVKS